MVLFLLGLEWSSEELLGNGLLEFLSPAEGRGLGVKSERALLWLLWEASIVEHGPVHRSSMSLYFCWDWIDGWHECISVRAAVSSSG